jgi:hypothetical protein
MRIGVDEKPFPLQCDDLNRHGRSLNLQSLRRIKIMRAHPCERAEDEYDFKGDRPPDELRKNAVFLIRRVERLRVASAIPIREEEGEAQNRNDDDQRQQRCIDEERTLL